MRAHEKSLSETEKKNRVFGTDDIIMMIDDEFADGKVTSKEIIRKLKEKGIRYVDIDKALVEAERQKIVEYRSGLYKWIDPGDRKARRAETERHHKILAKILWLRLRLAREFPVGINLKFGREPSQALCAALLIQQVSW